MVNDNKKILLDVKDLKVSFDTYQGEVQGVRGVSFYVNSGEVLGIVGESGCGKSTMVRALLKLLPESTGKIKDGSAIFDSNDLIKLSDKELEGIRGNEISMIFKDPNGYFNPSINIGNQMIRIIMKHLNINKIKAREKAIESLNLVDIKSAEELLNKYPNEISMGVKQRIMIAIALSCNPKLLICDEFTKFLDITTQSKILDILKDLQKKRNISIILISNDPRIILDFCDRIIIMNGGLIIEEGTTQEIYNNPKHPYTWGLLQAIPKHENTRVSLKPLKGSPVDLLNPPKGCPFASRCEYQMFICSEEMPKNTSIDSHHNVKCWLQHEMAPKVENPILKRRGKR